ncbi:hypothetical protein [Pseudoxanthomonas sp. UTMC 1351]|uniref:hypothetical protein n=1 Tax=Pseudoxanthomonas sp. UTMC 1351 TaxID=2695853 RepID=UPI0034CF96B2
MRLGTEYPDLPRAVIMLDPLLGPLPDLARPTAAVVMFGTVEERVAQNNDPFNELVAACRRQEI